MKRRDLIKRLEAIAKRDGLPLVSREGGRHTLFEIGDRKQPVPRHSEINELLARQIIKKMEG